MIRAVFGIRSLGDKIRLLHVNQCSTTNLGQGGFQSQRSENQHRDKRKEDDVGLAVFGKRGTHSTST